jgi:hypothetical protein
MMGITVKEYMHFHACDVKFVEIIWEFTQNGCRLKEQMVIKVERKNTPIWSFGSCNSCWKQVRRDFTNTQKTNHPLEAVVDDPSLPRLGRCGCVVCNECVMKLENHNNNKDEMNVHCPYCGNKDCFSKHMRIWLVSAEVDNQKYNNK